MRWLLKFVVTSVLTQENLFPLWKGTKRSGSIICLFAILISLVLASASQAQRRLVLEETYDNLPLGSTVSGWTAVEPAKDPTLPVVQNVSFKSPPHGMKVANDFNVLRGFSPLEGAITIELWMNPKLGLDTNSFLRIVLDGQEAGVYPKG